MNETAAPRGLRVRWWMWVVPLVLLLLSAPLVMRLDGFARLAAVQAELRSRGLATTPGELMAGAPAVDAPRQERLRLLMTGKCAWGDSWSYLPFTDLRERQVKPKDLTDLHTRLADGATTIGDLEQLMDEGPIVCSLFGWAERDPVRLGRLDFTTAESSIIPTLRFSRACTNWWGAQACLADDPEPYLRRLEQWLGCFDKPGCLIDAMITVAVSRIRDDACLWLATRGRLPPERLSAWAAEAPRQRGWCADGFASERCWIWEPMGRMGARDIYAMSYYLGSRWQTFPLWATQGQDVAQGVAALAGIEAQLRDRPWPPAKSASFGISGPLIRWTLPNLTESAVTAVEAACHHRLARIAGLLAQRYRQQSGLPADAAEAAAALPPHSLEAIAVDLPALRYERLSPNRFRIGIDPAGPLPPSVPAGRITSMIGKPASKQAADDRKWSLEIDLDAILVAPPAKPAKPGKPAASP